MKKIVLIEDNAEIRKNLQQILQMAGYHVSVAVDGRQGLDLIKKENPDLILCEVRMPAFDGYAILHIVSKNPACLTIPFVFLSTKNEQVDIRKGMDFGADDFLKGPIEGDELLRAVDTRLQKKEKLKAQFISEQENSTAILEQRKKISLANLIAEDRETKLYNKGQQVYKEGNYPRYLFYVISGKLKVFKSTEEGHELVTSILKEGDFFGYNALLEGSFYMDSVETLEDTELKLIPKEEFPSVMFGHNEVENQFIRLLTKNINEKEDQLLHLAYHSLRKRVADGLIYLQDKYKSTANGVVQFKISRQNLANVTGASKEAVIRILSDFKSEKLIDIKHGSIIILESRKLQKLFN